MLFIKVIKSRKWKNIARNIILFRCSKALYFHTFSKMFLSKCTVKNIYNTPQIFSGMLKIAPKALHFLNFLGGRAIPPPPPKNGSHPLPFPYLPCGTLFFIPNAANDENNVLQLAPAVTLVEQLRMPCGVCKSNDLNDTLLTGMLNAARLSCFTHCNI